MFLIDNVLFILSTSIICPVLQRPNFKAEAHRLSTGMLVWLLGASARILFTDS